MNQAQSPKPPKLVMCRSYGVMGINFYFINREKYNITLEELAAVGVTDDEAYVSEEIITSLQMANRDFRRLGYEIFVKDAYRSIELYQLVQRKRYELNDKESTDALLNTETMPHSTGKVVDISLFNIDTSRQVWMRDDKDGDPACFVGFYANKEDAQSQEYERMQKLMREVMFRHGFKLGVKNEYWHFEYSE